MNHHLQFILTFIQQSDHLSAEEKTALSTAAKDADKELEITSFKLERTEKVKHATAILLEETIGELEQKRKAVETQNRELEIESALERVRTVAMSMNKRDDMLHVCRVISEQLQHLGVPEIRNVQTAIFYETKVTYVNYEFYTRHDKTLITEVEYKNHAVQSGFADQMLKGPNEIFIHSFKGKEVQDWYEFQKTTNVFLDTYLETADSLNYYWYSLGPVALGFSTYKALNEDGTNLFMRFVKVFELSYRRYLDIEKAETQAREAQIQLALERVRARTMAMQKSNELSETVFILFQQFKELGENPDQATIGVINEDEKVIEYWVTMYGQPINKVFKFSFDEPNVTNKIYTAWKENKKSLVIDLSGNALSEFMTYRANKGGAAINPNEKRRVINVAFFSQGLLNVQSNKERSQESIKLLERFASVFEQTYTRFLDLQKAEAQAREAQIELGLERVRARAMAMQKSDELSELVDTVFKELTKLDFALTWCIINIIDESSMSNTVWAANPDINKAPESYHMLFEDYPFHDAMMKGWKERKIKYVYTLEGSEKKIYDDYLFSETEFKRTPEAAQAASRAMEKYVVSFSFSNFGGLQTVGNEPLSDANLDILARFGKVFDLTYTRFNDLQKAEAQAREAQIEAALERVRSRTMGMQHSNELQETALLLFQQVLALGVSQLGCGFNIWDDDRKAFTSWMGGGLGENTVLPTFNVPTSEDIFLHIREAAERGESLFVREQSGEELEKHYRYMFSLPIWKDIMKGWTPPAYQVLHCAFFTQGFLMFISQEPVPQAHDIYKRFAKVFEQTYTRFLDLQKAETQARESQIQLALERVRARTMAMQHSDELKEAAALLFQQAKALGVPAYSCGYNIWEKDDKEFTSWMSTQDGSIINGVPNIPLTEDANFIRYVESKEKRETFFVLELRGGRMQEHYKYLKTIPAFKAYFDYAISVGFDLPETQIHHLANFSHGNLLFISLAPCPEFHDVFKRFAAVFDQTYTRFLDLQRAEAQAREATKQASLDRVRGQIASMRSTEDLERITPLIWHELTMLGVPFIRCGVLIIDEVKAEAHIYLSSPDGHSLAAMNLPLQSNTLTANSVAYWRKGLVYTEHWTQEDFVHWMQSMIEQGQVQNPETYQGAAKPPESLHLHFVPFTQGMLYVGNTDLLTDDEIDLVKSLAEAFSIAYARYEDFTKLEKAKQSIEVTLTELKATQTQLIQSEKMASLGELTAGIAHEIQNPLNFVNNFSEVNKELLAEMTEEIDKGNFDEVKLLAKDVTDNEEKINHHGKRADAIVKGMLQHSRSSTGVKEPTDINALADEYLRLTYHGLRAKDKSFNATVKTDFEAGLKKVNIIPQDIGRVILNLITNAFYAVNEKQKACEAEPVEAGYEPTVTVSTKQNDGAVEITIADNGDGIPQKVLDKIFQPFFTTKPTGQGTGLGLSLSYDIIKAHGGEIKVETKEGEGTEFIIQLPIV